MKAKCINATGVYTVEEGKAYEIVSLSRKYVRIKSEDGEQDYKFLRTRFDIILDEDEDM